MSERCIATRLSILWIARMALKIRKSILSILQTKNAYDITNKLEIKNKKILLFDDVFTTGSTTNECSRILKENGAKKIGVLTIAKD